MTKKLIEFEKCGDPWCNNETPNEKGTKIDDLVNYVDGAGISLCNDCWKKLYPEENIQE